MIVIYTADVEAAQEVYDLGGITLKIEVAYLVNMTSNHIYQKLQYKIENHELLTEEELMELMILPLTAKGIETKQEYIIKVVELAKKLPNQNDVHTVIAGLLTFTDKFIEPAYAEKLRRELTMLTKVEQIIIDEYKEAIEHNMNSVVQIFKDVGIDKQTLLPKLMDKFFLSEDKAQKIIENNWK